MAKSSKLTDIFNSGLTGTKKSARLKWSMAYSESKKLTDTEKRLQVLKTQLFGKEKNQAGFNRSAQNVSEKKNMQTIASIMPNQSRDLTYLRHDLLKIVILALIVIGVQLILYMQLTFKVLNIN